MRSAVLFLVFSRPETTSAVFDAIRKAEPPKLYVAADGPRADRPGERERCDEVRRIAMNVDWPCELKTLLRDHNLGCQLGPSTAINWFFEHEPEGIILEDDCLPSASFFGYCDELLDIYRNDERIFLISGYNRRNVWKPEKADYFFSNYGGIWGWASWRRAWQHFDLEMKEFEKCVERGLFEDLLGRRQGRARMKALQRVKQSNMDAWDYQWGFARHKNGALACVPSKSLIQNIGYGPNATHTFRAQGGDVSRHELSFPMRPNTLFAPDRAYDEVFVEYEAGWRELARRLRATLRR